MRLWALIAVTMMLFLGVTRGEASDQPLPFSFNPPTPSIDAEGGEEGQLSALKDTQVEVKDGDEGEKDKVEGRLLGLLGGGGGYGGGYGGLSKSTKVYSLLALIAFSAFIAYCIYFFITSTEEARSGDLYSDQAILQGILSGVEAAIRKFTTLQGKGSGSFLEF
ncbi:uncharacterized protein LOC126983445 [Eriocheir sinensis]|uniref:uncharacterized protein LOC126983445 n=1 Tax=Eriocheir sinensis TaxID=95602 RepID=UPI0021C575B8|nr:uncharacterized protein LOC126983445 [Eriocheir sinensis]